MAVVLPQGTKEYLIVDMEDAENLVTDLSGATPTFDVKDQAGALKYTSQTATATLMKVRCLVDTMSGGAWAAGTYRLYVKFVIGSEAPKIGPFEFEVSTA